MTIDQARKKISALTLKTMNKGLTDKEVKVFRKLNLLLKQRGDIKRVVVDSYSMYS